MPGEDSAEQPDLAELPKVGVTTCLASQFADLYSLKQDLAMVRTWCREIDSLGSKESTDEHQTSMIQLGLWKAALITYRRCWTYSPSAIEAGLPRLRPLDDWLDQAGLDHGRATHEAALTQANKNVAHQVDDSEQFAVSVFPAPHGEPRDVVAAGVLGGILVVPTDGAVGRLADLAQALSAPIASEIERGHQKLIEQGRRYGVEKLYRLAGGNKPDNTTE